MATPVVSWDTIDNDDLIEVRVGNEWKGGLVTEVSYEVDDNLHLTGVGEVRLQFERSGPVVKVTGTPAEGEKPATTGLERLRWPDGSPKALVASATPPPAATPAAAPKAAGPAPKPKKVASDPKPPITVSDGWLSAAALAREAGVSKLTLAKYLSRPATVALIESREERKGGITIKTFAPTAVAVVAGLKEKNLAQWGGKKEKEA